MPGLLVELLGSCAGVEVVSEGASRSLAAPRGPPVDGPTWARTRDRPVMSQLLYQLSYRPGNTVLNARHRAHLQHARAYSFGLRGCQGSWSRPSPRARTRWRVTTARSGGRSNQACRSSRRRRSRSTCCQSALGTRRSGPWSTLRRLLRCSSVAPGRGCCNGRRSPAR